MLPNQALVYAGHTVNIVLPIIHNYQKLNQFMLDFFRRVGYLIGALLNKITGVVPIEQYLEIYLVGFRAAWKDHQKTECDVIVRK